MSTGLEGGKANRPRLSREWTRGSLSYMGSPIARVDRLPEEAVVMRTAHGLALAVLFAVWVASLVEYFDAFLEAATIQSPMVPHNPLAALVAITALGLTPIVLIASTLPLGLLLAATRLCLPIPDRDTLGFLAGAWIVTLDVATLGNRFQFFSGRAIAPLLGALISIGGLRIVITAALRRWSVRSRRAAIYNR
jgi:hypothetical protein